MPVDTALLPHLFRTEYSKIIAVLVRRFGFEHMEIAEDIAGDTFLLASETWGIKGVPENPAAWLYMVAKNKAKDHLKKSTVFSKRVKVGVQREFKEVAEPEIDLSGSNIKDSQLQMMFAICHPSIPAEAQVGLALRILCGFSIEEIASSFLTSKETVNKRLFRAKEKLRNEHIKIEFPAQAEMEKRLSNVLTTLYLLFNEGYYSISQNTPLRKELCLEAMRLNFMLIENGTTNKPCVNALLSLMCFHTSRFEARISPGGEGKLYEEQDTGLWNQELINLGKFYLAEAAKENELSKYHLEAAIAYWHTYKEDSTEKWLNILQLYDQLLRVEYAPTAALNRVYALSKTRGKPAAIQETEKLQIVSGNFYFSLLGYLYTDIDDKKAMDHYRNALKLSKSKADQKVIQKYINRLSLKLPEL